MKLPSHYTREPRIIGCDVDGVLCKGESWTPEQCLKAKPCLEVIKKVNELYKAKHIHIVIFTSRRDHLIPATLEWLRRNGVRFHSISNNKMAADWYLDDKATNVKGK